MKELYEYVNEETIYHNLRVMNRNYEDQLDHLMIFKVTFQNILNIVFPRYLLLLIDSNLKQKTTHHHQ